MPQEPLVCIIDDDEAIRESLRLLLYSADLGSHCYTSADDFLADEQPREFDCMLLDIRMPGTDGLELFRELKQRQVAWPVIFIPGHGDIPLAVSAIKQGAFDFLTKPFREGELLDKLDAAISYYRNSKHQLVQRQEMQARFGRARNYGEKSIGHLDPGAGSASYMFKGFAEALNC